MKLIRLINNSAKNQNDLNSVIVLTNRSSIPPESRIFNVEYYSRMTESMKHWKPMTTIDAITNKMTNPEHEVLVDAYVKCKELINECKLKSDDHEDGDSFSELNKTAPAISKIMFNVFHKLKMNHRIVDTLINDKHIFIPDMSSYKESYHPEYYELLAMCMVSRFMMPIFGDIMSWGYGPKKPSCPILPREDRLAAARVCVDMILKFYCGDTISHLNDFVERLISNAPHSRNGWTTDIIVNDLLVNEFINFNFYVPNSNFINYIARFIRKH